MEASHHVYHSLTKKKNYFNCLNLKVIKIIYTNLHRGRRWWTGEGDFNQAPKCSKALTRKHSQNMKKMKGPKFSQSSIKSFNNFFGRSMIKKNSGKITQSVIWKTSMPISGLNLRLFPDANTALALIDKSHLLWIHRPS